MSDLTRAERIVLAAVKVCRERPDVAVISGEGTGGDTVIASLRERGLVEGFGSDLRTTSAGDETLAGFTT